MSASPVMTILFSILVSDTPPFTVWPSGIREDTHIGTERNWRELIRNHAHKNPESNQETSSFSSNLDCRQLERRHRSAGEIQKAFESCIDRGSLKWSCTIMIIYIFRIMQITNRNNIFEMSISLNVKAALSSVHTASWLMCLQCRKTLNTLTHTGFKFHRHRCTGCHYCRVLTLVMCVVVVVLVVSEVMVWALSNTPGSKSPLVSTCWKRQNPQLILHVSLVKAHPGRV